MTDRNMAASVRARLFNKARADGMDFQRLLTRYSLERLLYRLSISSERDHFLLKGALLFDLWYDVPLRPTRDIDLLGFGLAEVPHLVATFEQICMIGVDDGMCFDANTIEAEEIRKEANYTGIRIKLTGRLAGARCPVQIDVGYGDAVTPAPESANYPVILDDMPAPHLRVYPRYTVVAEKLEAIISLGMANSRMKDYFDLWVILQDSDLDQAMLKQALLATLGRRKTLIPKRLPIGLSETFATDPQKNAQWGAFLKRNELNSASLTEVVQYLRCYSSFIFE